MRVLDLFSAAAGGWSLGMHRAGYRTMAACEVIPWRRALYSENNPGVKVYDDVRSLSAGRLLDDFGYLPAVIVGSPPCQDISSANTKGKGVEGERSGLYFEAVRLIGECRPRWFALENSANLRTRGADAVLSALEAIGYACWPFVVRAGDIGANHERPRSWLIGCDVGQLTAYANGHGEHAQSQHGEMAVVSGLGVDRHPAQDGCGSGLPGRCAGAATGAEQPACGDALHAASLGHEGGWPRRHGQDGHGAPPVAAGNDADTIGIGPKGQLGGDEQRQGEISERPDLPARPEMAICSPDRRGAVGSRADWSLDDLARHIRVDDGLSAWVAGTRVAVGGPKGTSAASLIVEAFGDAVVPQIPEAIGRAILRTEAALAAVYERIAA
ncbi:C-5 cytosine-specific DNA methylase [Sphingomonas sp. MM-1]|nr:C-5 cytosine-specific DNA methylase [Sphingomonas sp. MM-1]